MEANYRISAVFESFKASLACVFATYSLLSVAEAAQGIEALGHWLETKVGFAFLIFVTLFWFMVTMHGN